MMLDVRRGWGAACYIDIETDNEDDEDVAEADESAGGGQRHREYSQWNDLPDLLLERIFAYLPIRERYYASLVSKQSMHGGDKSYNWISALILLLSSFVSSSHE